ncbi:MAG: GNAT family N-acetyltransferase [Gammaproteobacteria bacterium]|nr:GNAT family N-acetyltransferase [Gammaproteobacteria bacterium]
MNAKDTLHFQEIEPTHTALAKVIQASIGNPTPEKIQSILRQYANHDQHLIGCFSGTLLIGVIGIQLTDTNAIIEHISVLKNFQARGIGKKLIQYVINHFNIDTIKAETDDDAVEFYQAQGFDCVAFEGKYGRRYTALLTNLHNCFNLSNPYNN